MELRQPETQAGHVEERVGQRPLRQPSLVRPLLVQDVPPGADQVHPDELPEERVQTGHVPREPFDLQVTPA